MEIGSSLKKSGLVHERVKSIVQPYDFCVIRAIERRKLLDSELPIGRFRPVFAEIVVFRNVQGDPEFGRAGEIGAEAE